MTALNHVVDAVDALTHEEDTPEDTAYQSFIARGGRRAKISYRESRGPDNAGVR
jgi:hypothetical protein